MHPSRFIAAVLIAMWLLTPEVLCLLPGVALTMDEHECCERMAGQCGRVPMPDLHKCCQTVTSPNAVITTKAAEHREPQIATVSFINSTADVVRDFAAFNHGLHSLTTSPPPLTSHESLAVLRI